MDARYARASGWRGRPSPVAWAAAPAVASTLIPLLIFLAMIAVPLLLARMAAQGAPSTLAARSGAPLEDLAR